MDLRNIFTTFDWTVVIGYLALTTLVGHLLAGKQSNVKDFFQLEKTSLYQRTRDKKKVSAAMSYSTLDSNLKNNQAQEFVIIKIQF